MNDVCIPIPRMLPEQAAEVEVKVNGKSKRYNYRVESFQWGAASSEEIANDSYGASGDRINSLKNQIEGYDNSWELVQIYNPRMTDERIHVLFRQRA